MNEAEAFKRGQYDARRYRDAIFRSTRRGIVPTIDDPMADDWSEENRQAYLDGYEAEVTREESPFGNG